MNSLHSIRKTLALSQADLAAGLGITQSAVSQYEIAVCDPSLDTARRLIDFALERGIELTLDEIYASPESTAELARLKAIDDAQPPTGGLIDEEGTE